MGGEKEFYLHILKRQEEKLKEFMGEKEFLAFTDEIAKEAFRKTIDGMPDSEFKEFCKNNFDAITDDEKWARVVEEAYEEGGDGA